MPNYVLSNYRVEKEFIKLSHLRYLIAVLLCALLIFINSKNFDAASGVTLTSEQVATIYIDAPLVQASYTADPLYPYGGITENFNFDMAQISSNGYAASQGAQGYCPGNIAIGTISPTEDCLVYSNDPYFGGATTDVISDPYDVGEHSTYIATHEPYATNKATPLTITFDGPKQYIGFWWSAGSAGNQVTFLDASGTVIAQLNANEVFAASTQNANPMVGDPYPSGAYFGHPGELLNPDDPSCSRFNCLEPYVYIHAIAAAGKTFGGVQLTATGNGFEFDNFTTANDAPPPLDRFVLIRQITSAFTLPAPENTNGFGFSFGGWYDDPNLNFYSYIGMPGQVYSPSNSEQEIYPSWNPLWITIEYIFEGTEFYCNFTGYWQDPTYPVPENIFNAQSIDDNCDSNLSNPGFRLVAWNTAADGNGTTYNFGAPVDSENLTLYPMWDVASSNLIAPDVVLVDPRVNFVSFPNISVDGSANILMCIQQSNAAGVIDESPAVGFDVLTIGIGDVSGIGSANINGDATTSLLVSGELQDVLNTVNASNGLRAYLSSGNFNSTSYIRIRTLPIASPETEVDIASCNNAAISASKTIEIRPYGITQTLRKSTVPLKD